MPKPYKSRNKFATACRNRGPNATAILCVFLFTGCGLFSGLFGSSVPKNPDDYHIGTHEWVGDSISVRVYRTSSPSEHPSLPKIEAECRSCNLSQPPVVLAFNGAGVASIYFPEARSLASVRIHLHGSGIDTTFIQKQRPPEEAIAYYHLSQPLIGRVFVEQLAELYRDTTQDSVLATAEVGDELNIFGEHSAFYIVHHPNFSQPLYLLKADAVRLQ